MNAQFAKIYRGGAGWCAVALLAALLPQGQARAALADLSTSPLVTSSSTVVKPNIMFVLDDSGSMGWDYLPDLANDAYCKNASGGTITPLTGVSSCQLGDPPYSNSDWNGVYYDPATTYTPPIKADGTSYPSFGSPWTAVKIDGYGVQSAGTINLTTSYPDRQWCTDAGLTLCSANNDYTYPQKAATPANKYPKTVNGAPYYYNIVPQEYCTGTDARTCTASTVPTGAFTVPGKIRWCTAAGACQAARVAPYTLTNLYGLTTAGTPAVAEVKATASFTISKYTGAVSKNISSIRVNGVEILGPTAASATNNGALAVAVLSRVNAYASAPEYTISCSGQCASGNTSTSVITVTALAGTGATPNGYSFAVTATAALTSVSATMGGGVTAAPAVPGGVLALPVVFQRIDIKPTTPTYYKYGTRTDCAGAIGTGGCTYAEEMTNFANWYAYYHTRMQAMKTAAGKAFSGIDSRYRVGYMSINNNTGSDFANIDDFNTAQKTSWYAKLYAANPGSSTPLRAALSIAGRIYAKDITSYNSVAVIDPIKYSCQQNFTILSTDGYWNSGSCNSGSAGCYNSGAGSIIGGGAMGNYDNNITTMPRTKGMYDGGLAGSSGTLADIAAYYYNTDLRPAGSTGALGTDVSQDNVPTTSTDTAPHQHMTTFTLGLGAPGDMVFSPTYENDSTGDFFNITQGTINNASSLPCPWAGALGTCNWPSPAADQPSAIDDLWHAAVNGRGTYFSAGNPTALSAGLSSALAGVSRRIGAAAAATTSNPNVTSGDNFVFSTTFVSKDWVGEVVRQQINLSTGAVSPTIDWASQALLDAKISTASTNDRALDNLRTIYTFDPAGVNKVKAFAWANLTSAGTTAVATAEQSYFDSTKVSLLSQYPSLSAANQTAMAGNNLVKFLRGDMTNKGWYRDRVSTLGDIVSAEAVYVKTPMFEYIDSGYSTFRSSKAAGATARLGMVYVASNDGMLHAFTATDGQESWAYVPSIVMPNLYKLADATYDVNHRYFVDGTPTVGDVYFGGAWHTILVGGLNNGGRGYYALDVTNPASPTVLWEFTSNTAAGTAYISDADLGYSYGNPIITKRYPNWLPLHNYIAGDRYTNGSSVYSVTTNYLSGNVFGATDTSNTTDITAASGPAWTVIVTSGYNNVSPGNGKGYIYVLDAQNGTILRKIGTNVGDTNTAAPTMAASPTGCVTVPNGPSGLARINAWIDNRMTDNAAQQIYGGDLYGNLWVFDPNAATGTNGTNLVTFRSPTVNCVQPITTKPELAQVDSMHMAYVGTGRYLGASDMGNLTPNTFYGVKDWTSIGSWRPSHDYTINNLYVNAGTAYRVTSNYTSGSTFGLADTTHTTIITVPTIGTTFRANAVQQVLTNATDPVTLARIRTSTANPVNLYSDFGWYIDFPATGDTPATVEISNTDPTIALDTLVFTTNVPNGSACSIGGYSFIYFINYKTGSNVPSSSLSAGTSGKLLAQALATRPVVVSLPGGAIVALVKTSDTSTVVSNVPVGGSSVARRVFWRELIDGQ